VICRITGRLLSVTEDAAVVDVGGICREVLVPRSALGDLSRLNGSDVTLFTLEYLDGNPAMGHLVPRIVGFLTEAERGFFNELQKVKGLGVRKALRAMSVPAHQIARAIESGDERSLANLPEIGKRTATQMVAQLRGKLERFLAPAAGPAPVAQMTAAQTVALDILVHWGDRRADAQRWIAAAVEADPELKEPDEIVRAAYRIKNAGAI
jgi:Holliday junction DNA helicase RuvA